jgi:hypothetical protein
MDDFGVISGKIKSKSQKVHLPKINAFRGDLSSDGKATKYDLSFLTII